MNDVVALSKLGLTEIEGRIYLFLLRQGPSLGSSIQTGLNLTKVPVYRALGTLRQRGLVSTTGEARNQKFVATDLDKVLADYDQKLQSLSQARSQLESFILEIAGQQSALYKDNRIKTYEGKEGYRLWMEERLLPGTTEIHEFGTNTFVEQFFDSTEDMKTYMNDYIARRVAKNITIKTLGTNKRLHEFDVSSTDLYKEQRSVDSSVECDVLLSTFGTKVGFYTLQDKKYLGVIIDDPMLARLMDVFFMALWEKSQPVTK